MRKSTLFFPLAFASVWLLPAHAADNASWYFAVSGDSRNCGDIVMPAIARDAQKYKPAFYWHLGDIRAISGPDQDFIEEHAHEGKPADPADYEKQAWDDFVENQIKPWGEVPFYLGIGNHEVVAPKNRAAFVARFQTYLDRPELREQRLKDDPQATSAKTYFHWQRDGIDFIYLDNATLDQFDAAQLDWFRGVLGRDRRDPSIRTVVVGMHRALPESISANHSMNESPTGVASGRLVYHMLLKFKGQRQKTVYVLASHSHYFMDGTFNTTYWKAHGGVLPGWIVGTAGAERYPLPPTAIDAKFARTNIYGYLLGAVNPAGKPPGTIHFHFEELKEESIPGEVVTRFTRAAVHECFVGNRRSTPIE